MKNKEEAARLLERLRAIDSERILLARSAAALQWDAETYLGEKGVGYRAEQIALLEGLSHDMLVQNETGDLLAALETDRETDIEQSACGPGDNEWSFAVRRDFLRALGRDYKRAVKLPADFVRACARDEALSQAAWAAARKNNDFAAFAPHLQKMLDNARAKSEYWGFAGRVYDGLLDSYEPGFFAADIARLFTPLRKKLAALLQKIASAPKPETAFLYARYGIEKQREFNRELMEGLGFDFGRGRLDTSAHPFTTTLGPSDVRITTRYAETDPLSGIFSVIHETGHAFYELNVEPSLGASCLGEGTSMGIHESQSRLWENVIGRGRAFWEGWFPRLKACFPAQLDGVTADAFYRGLNTACPGLIRTEADELSYSLHVILRFDLEQRLFDKTLSVDQLPDAWNRAMSDYLGIEPPDDARGALQDVHWSMGSFGYFPSYALGNLYALHFWQRCRADLPRLDGDLAGRRYRDLHAWLRENIHRWGRRLDPAGLLAKVCGETLSEKPFVNYIEKKYTELYGI
ncbi:MAG: carboxypeptidase M32 [Treponema sp.]|jgi:carboxypeptidase Taq|nr:carboxypeptidase M32 [Treponema sp.]